MKFFILEGFFTDHVLSEYQLKELITAHLNYLEAESASERILFSGPKADTGGGIIMMKVNDRDEIIQFCRQDPLVLAGVQKYNVTEFIMHDCQQEVKDWFVRS